MLRPISSLPLEAPSKSFTYTQAKPSACPGLKGFEITTANLGLLSETLTKVRLQGRSFLNAAQTLVGQSCSEKKILGAPSTRAAQIAETLLQTKSPVICVQELFDQQSSVMFTEALSISGYHVLSDVGKVDSRSSFEFANQLFNFVQRAPIVNSGLLLASKYKIEQTGVQFYKFKDLTGECRHANKGVLRVPLQIDAHHTVIIYVSHFQAQNSQKDQETRSRHLKGILEIVQKDQHAHPLSPIFFVGDLNITDVEESGGVTNEYAKNRRCFFDHFQNCFLFDHSPSGQRSRGHARFIDNDLSFLNSKFHRNLQTNDFKEPDGSFYNMYKSEGHEVVSQCLYDYVLLFKGVGTLTDVHTELRHLMTGWLSDHLPLTMCADLTTLFPSS